MSIPWAGRSETRTKMRPPVGRSRNSASTSSCSSRSAAPAVTATQLGRSLIGLNAHDWTTATQRHSFNDRLVRMLLHRYGTAAKDARRPPNDNPNDWWLADLAGEIDVPLVTLYGSMKRGSVRTGIRGRCELSRFSTETPPKRRESSHRPLIPKAGKLAPSLRRATARCYLAGGAERYLAGGGG